MLVKIRKSRFVKVIAIFLAITLLKDVIYIDRAFALTSGPSQPEVQSFEPAQTNQMVDPFSGDFTYNIPLFELPGPNGGYPFNLAYHSGIGIDQEASWVGLGWNINPGAIMRNVRGIPDDFSGTDLYTQTLDMKPNRTFGVQGGLSGKTEFFGWRLPIAVGGNVGGKIYYNNYKGCGIGFDFGVTAGVTHRKFGLKAGVGIDSQNGSSASLGITYTNNSDAKSSLGISANSFGAPELTAGITTASRKSFSVRSPLMSFADRGVTPTIPFETIGLNIAGHFSYGFEGQGFFAGWNAGFFWQSERVRHMGQPVSIPAYGYMNLEKANPGSKHILDCMREKDGMITKNTPNLASPILTYDYYSIMGQGIGQMYRPFRTEIGHMYELPATSYDGGLDASMEMANVLWHTDFSLSASISESSSGDWTTNNAVNDKYKYREYSVSDLDPENIPLYNNFENIYFKSHGEKTTLPLDELGFIGGEGPVKIPVDLHASGFNFKRGRIPAEKLERKDGSLVQTLYNTREEQSRIPRESSIQVYKNSDISNDLLGEYIISYNNGTGTETISRLAHPNHIAGITALNADGMRYVYALPAYNNKKTENLFSVDVKNLNVDDIYLTNLTSGNMGKNAKQAGSEKFSKTVITPPYAHSYLLTSVLGSDYVDCDGTPGPSDGDMGYWVKFNYKRTSSAYKWRAPYWGANYQPGLANFTDDDKASYMSGEKEIWYLESAETSTHRATFTLGSRNDGRGAEENNYAETCSTATATGDINTQSRLEKIDLFSKTNPTNPIKTIHFGFEYSLCRKCLNNNPNPTTTGYETSGKLTLNKLYFTYENNNRGELNPYTFKYETSNPDYDINKYDTWGNYRDDKYVFNGVLPGPRLKDFPYVIQKANQDPSENQTTKDNQASVWCLNKIELPSGGIINVKYESDDYAYVQHRKTTQMFEIVKLGSDNTVFDNGWKKDSETLNSNKLRLYIKLDNPSDGMDDFKSKYIDGLARRNETTNQIEYQLYFKVKIKLRGNIYEYVSGYADIDLGTAADPLYGVEGANGYITLKSIKTDPNKNWWFHPFAAAAWQFMRATKPQLLTASSGMDDQEEGSTMDKALRVKSMLGMFNSFHLIFQKYSKHCFNNQWGNKIKLSESWVKLCTPDMKKYGGGCRVSEISINNNWKQLSGSTSGSTIDIDASYGQAYDYTMLENDKEISSGVATFEPQIGGDENALRYAKKYAQSIQTKTPNSIFFEYPVNESLYPEASVGYRKITVKSLASNIPNKRGTGSAIYEYYTCKDFPVISDETSITHDDKNYLIPILIGQIDHYSMVASQGYSIELNDMHGKLKKISYYSQSKSGDIDETLPVSYVSYEYQTQNAFYDNTAILKLDNVVDVVNKDNQVSPKLMGIEYDFITDMRSHASSGVTEGVNLNFDAVVVPLLPPVLWIPSGVPIFSSSSSNANIVTTNKIIFKSGILKNIKSFDGYALTTTQNKLFDAITGNPVLTSVNTQYSGQEKFNYNSLAYHEYDGMGPAYLNVGMKFSCNVAEYSTDYSSNIYSLDYTGNTISDLDVDGLLVPGDEYIVSQTSTSTTTTTQTKAVYLYKKNITSTETKYLIYCSAGLNPDLEANFLVTRSGRRNMLNASAGSVVSLENPFTIDGLIPQGDFELGYDKENRMGVNPSESDLKQLFLGALHNYGLTPSHVSYNGFNCKFIPNSLTGTFEVTGDIGCYGQTETVRYKLMLFNGAAEFDYCTSPFCSNVCSSVTCSEDHFTIDPYPLENNGIPPELPGSSGYLFTGLQLYNHLTKSLLVYRQIYPATDLLTRTFHVPYFNKVLNITAANFSDLNVKEFGYSFNPTLTTSTDPYTTGERGVWKTDKSFSFKVTRMNSFFGKVNEILTEGGWPSSTQVTGTPLLNNTLDVNLKEDGIFLKDNSISMPCFSWLNSYFQRLFYVWLPQEKITAYNESGFPVENRDHLGIFNSVIYGYKNLVVAAAKNAKKDQIAFEGFEENRLNPISTTNVNAIDNAKGNFLFAGSYSTFNRYKYYEIRSAENIDDPTNTNPLIVSIENNHAVLERSANSETQLTRPWRFWITTDYYNVGSTVIKPFSLFATATDIPISETSSKKVYIHDDIFTVILGLADSRLIDHSSLTWSGIAGELINYPYTSNDASGAFVSDLTAHTGKKSLKVTGDEGGDGTISFNQPLLDLTQDCFSSYVFSGWVKVTGKQSPIPLNVKTPDYKFLDAFSIRMCGKTMPLTGFKGNIIDGWQKFEFEFDQPITGNPNIPNNPNIPSDQILTIINKKPGQYFVFIDDIRIYPVSSSIVTYVYNPLNLKVSAMLDENNYATFYYYDESGNLFLTKRETEKGIKTIQETRSKLFNMPLSPSVQL